MSIISGGANIIYWQHIEVVIRLLVIFLTKLGLLEPLMALFS